MPLPNSVYHASDWLFKDVASRRLEC
jgi:hypothetical protein